MKKNKLNVYVNDELSSRIKYYCSKNNESISKLFRKSVIKYLHDESNWELLFKRLNRNDNFVVNMDKRINILSEAFTIFVKYWLSLTPELSFPRGRIVLW